jgi:hypothetical protein
MAEDKDWIKEFFGEAKARPDHPDLMRLSEVLLKADAEIDPKTMSQDEMEVAHARVLKEVGIDPEVVSYTSIQRAMRLENVNTRMELIANAMQVIKSSSMWLDGFRAGAAYREKIMKEEGWSAPR